MAYGDLIGRWVVQNQISQSSQTQNANKQKPEWSSFSMHN
jgi:hypothetical protein